MTEYNHCTALVGGASGALDNIALADITGGEVAFVWISATRKFYPMMFDSSSSDAEAVPDGNGKVVVKPDDAGASNGRWESFIIHYDEIDHDALTNFTQDEHKTIAEARTDTGALVVESRTNDTPTDVGRIWVRTDL